MTKDRSRRIPLSLLAAVLFACSSPGPAPTNATGSVTAAATKPSPRTMRFFSAGKRGTPRMLWDTSGRAFPALTYADAARAHLERHRDAYGVSRVALATVRPVRSLRVRSGVT